MLIHGQTASNILTPLLVDATGRPLVVLDGVTGSVVTVQASGGDKLFSMESVVERVYANTALAAGSKKLDSDAVPTSKVWVISVVVYRYDGTTAGVELQPQVIHDSGPVPIENKVGPTSTTYYRANGPFYLDAGDFIRLNISGAVLNDDAYIALHGYQMDA